MKVVATFFWNGHELKPNPTWSERLVCVHCGAVTSYAQFRSTITSIKKCTG